MWPRLVSLRTNNITCSCVICIGLIFYILICMKWKIIIFLPLQKPFFHNYTWFHLLKKHLNSICHKILIFILYVIFSNLFACCRHLQPPEVKAIFLEPTVGLCRPRCLSNQLCCYHWYHLVSLVINLINL